MFGILGGGAGGVIRPTDSFCSMSQVSVPCHEGGRENKEAKKIVQLRL